MAERTETMAAIDGAIGTAESLVAMMKTLREVAKLPDAPMLANAPRQIVLSQTCTTAAGQCNQLLDEITTIHRSMTAVKA